MKLETSIQLRADGSTVMALGHKFVLDRQSGLVVGDVENEEVIAALLKTGNFFPVDEADHEIAAALVDMLAGGEKSDSDESEDDDSDDDADLNALPVEAGTPPAPKKKGKKAE
jgi:hypothetical protein